MIWILYSQIQKLHKIICNKWSNKVKGTYRSRPRSPLRSHRDGGDEDSRTQLLPNRQPGKPEPRQWNTRKSKTAKKKLLIHNTAPEAPKTNLQHLANVGLQTLSLNDQNLIIIPVMRFAFIFSSPQSDRTWKIKPEHRLDSHAVIVRGNPGSISMLCAMRDISSSNSVDKHN